MRAFATVAGMYISIHVPREGHDRLCMVSMVLIRPFQSTCPARGTTLPRIRSSTARKISIHVPREGHDLTPTSASA